MEQTNNTIWIITNYMGGFIKACATREKALEEMKAWRENFIKSGLFAEVSKIDAAYYDHITFETTDREGNTHTHVARENLVF